MSKQKKEIRQRFREAVFARDGHRCRVCDTEGPLDAHHITPRTELPNGGYVPENGISLCPPCLEKAEGFLQAIAKKWDFSPYVPIYPDPLSFYSQTKLYELIGSSPEKALKASEAL